MAASRHGSLENAVILRNAANFLSKASAVWQGPSLFWLNIDPLCLAFSLLILFHCQATLKIKAHNATVHIFPAWIAKLQGGLALRAEFVLLGSKCSHPLCPFLLANPFKLTQGNPSASLLGNKGSYALD